jgi:hypothetical protein
MRQPVSARARLLRKILMNEVWVFNGEGGTFPAGVFVSKEDAEAWIKVNKLSGCLTKYPVGVSVYDWAIAEGYWTPKQEHQRQPQFIQQFSSAYLEHYHYEAGD